MGAVKWVTQAFIAAFIAMVFIYFIKGFAVKYQVPVVKTIAEGI